MAESLLLKWGTLKGWEVETDRSKEALARYFKGGVSMSCAMQRDTDEQRQALFDLIDAIRGDIVLDWDGKSVSPTEARAYIRDYGKKKGA